MSNNGNGEVMKMCPFWKKTCEEVCPSCALSTPVVQTHVGQLGVPTQKVSTVCAFVAMCMIGSSRPAPKPINVPHLARG